MYAMMVKCFEIAEVIVAEVKFTTLKLVKELTFSGDISVDELSLKKFIKDRNLLECDCILLSSCNGSQCVEIFEYVKKLKSFKTALSPRVDKLIGLSILMKSADGKEVDVFYGSQVSVKQLEVPEEVYVFEGDLSINECNRCLGVILRTGSGARILLLGDGEGNVKMSKGSVRRRKRVRRKSRRGLKKKR